MSLRAGSAYTNIDFVGRSVELSLWINHWKRSRAILGFSCAICEEISKVSVGSGSHAGKEMKLLKSYVT